MSASADAQSPPPPACWQPHLAVAAWLLPGLGHAMLGQRQRGLIIGLTIMGLWLAGLLIGGITVIDYQHSGDGQAPRLSFWFVGQAMLSPSVVVDLAHQRLRAVSMSRFGHEPTPTDAPRPLYTPALSRVAEIGTLYTALAGLLNLLAILDVAWRPTTAAAVQTPTAETTGAPTA